MNTKEIFTLLILFQLKQYLGDFVLQTKYMLQKGAEGWSFLYPLLLHSAIHGTMTMLILFFVSPDYWWFGIIDFLIHALMDWIKAAPQYLGRYNDIRTDLYWRIFGLDQMVHHLTHVGLIWLAVAMY